MKLANTYLSYKNNYKETLVLIHSGNFFYTFLEDATLMNYLFGYKIIDNRVGFPISIAEKIKLKLKSLNIDYLIIEKDSYFLTTFNKNNNYISVIKKALKAMKKAEDLASLFKQISNKIDADKHNYHRILEYVNEL
ncbi:MAG: hypothetical protein IJN03_01895 [Bacilli bacterium]|nr:hypothetical protein [Bacilli bacterium]